MKPSEYGGADTDSTNGIQPPPNLVVEPYEQLRLLYATDPTDETSTPDVLHDPGGLST
jgi:hypothetical protein